MKSKKKIISTMLFAMEQEEVHTAEAAEENWGENDYSCLYQELKRMSRDKKFKSLSEEATCQLEAVLEFYPFAKTEWRSDCIKFYFNVKSPTAFSREF